MNPGGFGTGVGWQQFQNACQKPVSQPMWGFVQTQAPCIYQQPAPKVALEVEVVREYLGKLVWVPGIAVEAGSGQQAMKKSTQGDGRVRFEGLEEGEHWVGLPYFDGGLWEFQPDCALGTQERVSRQAAQWGPLQTRTDGWHTVREGEGLDKIALWYGRAPQSLWEHENNSELAKTRPGWNVLLAEDKVYIPQAQESWYKVTAGWRYRVMLKTGLARFRLRLRRGMAAMGQVPYVLEMPEAGSALKDTTDPYGVIDTMVPAWIRRMTVWFGDPWQKLELAFETLRPAGTAEGVEQRLRNLGFPYEGPKHKWAAGVLAAAHESAELRPVRTMTPELSAALERAHDR